jgi:hypothetical protein
MGTAILAERMVTTADISELELDRLVADINRDGFGIIANYVGEHELNRMRMFVSEAINAAGQQYVGFVGKAAVSESAFADLSDSTSFRSLMTRIYERGTSCAAPKAELYQVLRCLAGESGKAHSLIFHYDSYVVTALIPVEIPRTGRSGDLVMLRHRRGIRKTYLANFIDKLFLDNRLTQSVLRLLHEKGILPVTRIKMIPGNAYFFWGYQSIHANEACDSNHVRATAIYHFANPHAENKLRARVRSLFPR